MKTQSKRSLIYPHERFTSSNKENAKLNEAKLIPTVIRKIGNSRNSNRPDIE